MSLLLRVILEAGFGHVGEGQPIVKEILSKYISILGADQYENVCFTTGIEALNDEVCLFSTALSRILLIIFFYFRYRHSAGDSMFMMDADDCWHCCLPLHYR
jgi:hypothetical protein